MNSSKPLDEANNLIVQRLIRLYLDPDGAAVQTIYDACVTTIKISNRFGIPPDAVTVRYEFWHPDYGFAFDVRAVWRCGDLFKPVAVHTVIEDYTNKGNHEDDLAVRLAANDWLRST